MQSKINGAALAVAPSKSEGCAKLNLGCGRRSLEGWINVDRQPGKGIDIVADLERPLPFCSDSISEILLSHVIEHISNTLSLMQELHRVAKPDCTLTIRVPYGSSDDAHEDPTHVRQYFLNSFGYFSQPYYWRADYGYRGDWRTDHIHLYVDPRFKDKEPDQVMTALRIERNVALEMIAVMKAIKPPRAPEITLQHRPMITLGFHDE